MKVIWLTSWYPNPLRPFDGDFIQRHAIAVSGHLPVDVFYLDQSGHRVQVPEDKLISQGQPNLEERIIFFRFRPTGFGLIDKLLYNLRYFKTYRKVLRNYIREHGKPDLAHVHVPMKAGLIAKWLLRKYGIPYIVSEQSGHYQMGSKDDLFNKSARHISQVTSVFQQAIAVTNVSETVGKKLENIFKLPAVSVIRNTVNISLFNYTPPKNEVFRFVHVSTLNEEQKNIQGILSAVKMLAAENPAFELVLVGPATASLEERVKQLGIAQWVRLSGEISYREVAKEMQQGDAFVLFSRYENFPCVVVEALCCGLPVIASDVGGIREALNSSNGILVEKDNEQQLFEGMKHLLNHKDSYNRREISERASHLYNYDRIGKEFLDLYKEVLKK